MVFDSGRRIYDDLELQAFCNKCRDQSKTIVLATGAFDFLHPGHLKFLQASREYGDSLIVGLNDDEYIRKHKGADRPIMNQYDRAYLVAGFSCVSCVHIITPNVIQRVRPDIFVMSLSSDQKPADRTFHHELVEKFGGRVVVLDPYSTDHSSNLIDKIKDTG